MPPRSSRPSLVVKETNEQKDTSVKIEGRTNLLKLNVQCRKRDWVVIIPYLALFFAYMRYTTRNVVSMRHATTFIVGNKMWNFTYERL